MSIILKRADFFYDLAKLIIECREKNIILVPVHYFRSYEEQKKLVEEGKALSMHSKHIYGLAIDLVVIKDKKLVWVRSEEYETAGRIWREMGHTWGGDWEKLNDIYHFEI